MPPELSDEHVAATCRVLIDHGVQFVIIGGMAARLHDTGHATVDVDICPSTDDANLARLAEALSDLGARLRVTGDLEGVPFEPHADMLCQVELMTLITEHGRSPTSIGDGRLALHAPALDRDVRNGDARLTEFAVDASPRFDEPVAEVVSHGHHLPPGPFPPFTVDIETVSFLLPKGITSVSRCGVRAAGFGSSTVTDLPAAGRYPA